jgi:uncharacterized protein (TIGR02421 family)
MGNDLREIDRKISEILRKVDFYPHLTPLNRESEEKKFFENIRGGKAYDPVFVYGERHFAGEMGVLEKLRSTLDEEDGIQCLLAKKIDFMLTQLELLGAGDEDLTDLSVLLYGRPDPECLNKARGILSESKEQGYAYPEETVEPEGLASALRDEIGKQRLDWKVLITDKIVPKVTVSSKDRTIYVNSGIKYTEAEIQRLKVHEMQVHVFRGANGEQQPYRVFVEGLAGYNELEEGLAILSEEESGCLDIDTRQMKLYAGRAVSVDLAMNGSFYDTFAGLLGFFPDYVAYRLAERVKRGLRDTSKRGAFTKGFHYISGWRKLRKYIEEGGDLSILYVGKIGFDDVDTVRGLLDRGELRGPKYLPDFIERKERKTG